MLFRSAKAFDGSALFSDFVEIADINPTLTVELDINGKNIQSGDISLMMYKPEQMLAEIWKFMSLDEGDIVMTGTPKGVGVVKANQIFVGKIIVDGKIITRAEWLAK